MTKGALAALRCLYTHVIYLCIVTSMALAAPAYACDFDDADGLDVGLVLSGGGAKASTQVGVMELLDELGIPIHCITGASMGSVVGAFYATGYDAKDIGALLSDEDWGEIFRGQVPRRDKSFIAKEREENYFTGNVAALTPDGVKLPGGLSSMQGLKMHYRDILAHVPRDANFDDFDIPFRAVATDLSTGEAKAFERGDVVDAILASMAVPGLFAPRKIDGNLYVDGGISSTLPVGLAKAMGADIIIALDVSVKPRQRDADISVTAIANQLTGIMVWRTREAEVAKLSGDDLLILPNTVGIGTAAYDRSPDGLKAGRVEAEKYRDALLAIKAKAAPPLTKVRPQPLDLADFKTVALNNNTIVKDALITRRLDYTDSPPETLAEKDRRLRNLASFGGFGEVDLGYSQGDAVLTVDENVLGRNLMQVGFNATNDFQGNSSYALLGRLTRKPLGPAGGDVSLSFEFGTDIGVSVEAYQPFGPKGAWFIQPEVYATWDKQSFDVLNARVANLWIREMGLRGRIGREFGAWGVVALEGYVQNRKAKSLINIGEETFDTFNDDQASLALYAAADTLNRNDWPTSGHRARFRLSRLWDVAGLEDPANRIDLSVLKATEWRQFGLLFNGRYSERDSSSTASPLDGLFLGGFRQLSSVSDNSVPASEFIYGSVEAFHRLTDRGKLLDLPVYVGGLLEYANTEVNFLGEVADVSIISASVYGGIDTPLGPMFLGGAYGENEDLQFFFKFGRTF